MGKSVPLLCLLVTESPCLDTKISRRFHSLTFQGWKAKRLQWIIADLSLSKCQALCILAIEKTGPHNYLHFKKYILLLVIENPNFSKCCLLTEYVFRKPFHVSAGSDTCDWWRMEWCLIIPQAWGCCCTCVAVKCAPCSEIMQKNPMEDKANLYREYVSVPIRMDLCPLRDRRGPG